MKFVFNFDPAALLLTAGYVTVGGVPIDSDLDGVPNLTERLLGTNPVLADADTALYGRLQQDGIGPNQLSDETASRFLAQATWGPTTAEITSLKTGGIESWLNSQRQ